MKPGLIVFDDERAREWEPFSLTRPVGELLFGTTRIVERLESALGLECVGYLTSDHLVDFAEPGTPTVLRRDELPTDRALLYWCARAIPEPTPEPPGLEPPTAYAIGDRTVGYLAAAGAPPPDRFLDRLELDQPPATATSITGSVLEWIWDLVLQTPDRLVRDLTTGEPDERAALPAGVHVIGEHGLELGADVFIEPPALFDVRTGPIRLADGVEIRSGTRLAGPSLVGPASRLLGGSFDSICTGPYCYLRGEVVDSVILGYSNKAHDGYLGHAYVGRWVNLGAFTTNSDLKNNYHTVRVETRSGTRDTGALKVGCFLGDHVKTGIGLLLNTGTVVGAGANLFGPEMPPKYVPPFSWGRGEGLREYRLDAFLDTASRSMARRAVDADERTRRYLESCWREGRGREAGR